MTLVLVMIGKPSQDFIASTWKWRFGAQCLRLLFNNGLQPHNFKSASARIYIHILCVDPLSGWYCWSTQTMSDEFYKVGLVKWRSMVWHGIVGGFPKCGTCSYPCACIYWIYGTSPFYCIKKHVLCSRPTGLFAANAMHVWHIWHLTFDIDNTMNLSVPSPNVVV